MDVEPFFEKIQSVNPNAKVHVEEGLGHGFGPSWAPVLMGWLNQE